MKNFLYGVGILFMAIIVAVPLSMVGAMVGSFFKNKKKHA